MHHVKRFVTLVVVLLGSTLALAGSRIPSVTVTTVASEKMLAQVAVSGTLVAREEVQVFARIDGYQIEQIMVDLGDKVNTGDVLAQLDTEILRAQLAQVEAELSSSEAAVRQSQSQIDSAEANLIQAESVLTRNQSLNESGSVSQAMLDESISSADSARANFTSMENGLLVSQAQLRQMKVQLRLASLNLSRATITTPVGGVISARSARLGAVASNAGGPLFRIIGDGEIELEAEVIENALAAIQKGNRALIAVAGGAETRAWVRLISPTVDASTRLGLVRIGLPANAANRIGSFARGWIIVDERVSLAIPNSAIQATEKGDMVTVVAEGVIHKRQVRTGILYEGKREILDGLEEGELVLLRAGSFYRDGDQVEVQQVSTGDAAVSNQ